MTMVPNSYGSLREHNDCHSKEDGKFCSDGTVTRNGVATGGRANYQLLSNGKSVGRIKVKRSAIPMIGGPRTYDTNWWARRSGSMQYTTFSTQAEAEAFLLKGE